MSAFVVEDKTINRFLTWLRRGRDSDLVYLRKEIAEAAEIEIDDPDFYQKLGISMHTLNVRAVNARYSEENEPSLAYEFKSVLWDNRYQIVKSLKCWLYQCSEGDIPETPLFKAMDRVANDICYSIICDRPEYEQANWG